MKGIDEIWATDLIDMQSFAEYNDGFKYLLSVVDIFCKYGWIVPLKDKGGKSVSQAFEKIFTSSERKPKNYGLIKEKNFTIKMSKNSSSCIRLKMKKNLALSNDGIER